MTARRWALAALAAGSLQAVAAPALTEEELRKAVPGDVPEDAIFKAWTGMPDRTLVAWVDYEGPPSGKVGAGASPGNPDVPDVIDLTLLVVESGTGRELQRVQLDKVFTAVGVQFDHVEFDNANWTLAPGHRAFGVRLFGRHLGFVAEDTTTLLLLEPAGDTLRQVLALKTLAHVATRDCGVGLDVSRTIAIAKTPTQGRADLVVHERREDTPDDSAHKTNCHPKTRRSERTVTLRFDGTRYGPMAD